MSDNTIITYQYEVQFLTETDERDKLIVSDQSRPVLSLSIRAGGKGRTLRDAPKRWEIRVDPQGALYEGQERHYHCERNGNILVITQSGKGSHKTKTGDVIPKKLGDYLVGKGVDVKCTADGRYVARLIVTCTDLSGTNYSSESVIESLMNTQVGASEKNELDTIVVSAHPMEFKEIFLGKNMWRAVGINSQMIKKIKYIAVYQIAPISAITHIAPVKDITLWGESGKYAVFFSKPAEEIKPIPILPNGLITAPQGRRYASMKKIEAAESLDDVFKSSLCVEAFI